MSLIRSVLWLPLRLILLVLFSPIVTIGYWILVLVIGIPSQLFRKLVWFFARQVDKDLGNLVTCRGAIIGRDFDDWCTKPSQSVTTILKFKGKCDLESLKQHVLQTWVHKPKDKDGSSFEYPELQQFCTLRLGYLFFKWDRKFDISNHVKLYKSEEGKVLNDEKIQEIWENVARRGYAPKRSPWELFLVENYHPHGKIQKIGELEEIPEEERHFVWILRMHHGVCDGYSIYRLLIALTDQGIPLWEKETARTVPKCFDIILNLKAFFLGPLSLTKSCLQGFDILNALHYEKNRLTGKYSIVTSTLDVNVLKQARVLYNVSFHAVLLGAISGGIRKYLVKNKLSIPFLPLRLAMPITQPNHTTKLRNEWLSAMMDLPVDRKTAKQRVKAAEARLSKLKSGCLSPFLTQSMTLIGGFPVKAARFLTKKSGTTVMYSEMRAPNQMLTMFNKKLVLNELLYSFGLGTDDLGVGFSSISYNGYIKLILTLDQGIFKTKEKGEQLMTCILSEIEKLQFGDSTKLQTIL